jgi:hypothetical protein
VLGEPGGGVSRAGEVISDQPKHPGRCHGCGRVHSDAFVRSCPSDCKVNLLTDAEPADPQSSETHMRCGGVANDKTGGQLDMAGTDDIVIDHLSQRSRGNSTHLE